MRQRAAHAFAGRAGWLAEVLVASSMPSRNPRRGFLTENSPLDYFPIFLRLPRATKVVGRRPTPCQLSFEKAGQRTSSASAPAALRRRSQRNHRRGRALTSRSGAAFSRRPVARIARGATPADVLSPLDQARRFAAAPGRESPGVQPPARTCFFLSIRRGVSPPPPGANCSVRARTLVARSPHRADRAKVLFVVLVLPN